MFSSLQYLNLELILMLKTTSYQENPAAIIHSKGRLVAANKAWVELCDCPGEEVVQRDVSKGYMHNATREHLEKEYREKGAFQGRYTAFWSPTRCLQVVNQMSRIQVAPNCWYGLNILIDFKEVEPNGLTFEGD